MTSKAKVLPTGRTPVTMPIFTQAYVKVIMDNVPPSSRAKSVGAPMDIHKPLSVIPA